jgi:hypothetical protein
MGNLRKILIFVACGVSTAFLAFIVLNETRCGYLWIYEPEIDPGQKLTERDRTIKKACSGRIHWQ